MSFILDALKKSESERQQQTPAAFATVPSSESGPRAPRWLWVLGGLLAINIVVLLGLILRSNEAPPRSPAVVAQSVGIDQSQTQAVTSFAEQIEAARLNEPQRRASSSNPAPERQAASEAPVETGPAPEFDTPLAPQPTVRSTARLPTIYELQANGSLTLPELHLDIHVYSDTPEDRFVFINMSKLRERSQLAEGPTVEEITPDGVVLNHRGTTFLLPRD
jgi:general secretion pathway protein B